MTSDSVPQRRRHKEEPVHRRADHPDLQQAEARTKPENVWRRHGISRDISYRWRKEFAGMEASDARCLKQLEEENRRLKRLVADQALNIQVLKDRKRVETAKERRRVVETVQAEHQISERRAIRFAGFPRSSIRYRSSKAP